MNPSDLSGAEPSSAEVGESPDEGRYLVARAAGQRLAVPLELAREIIAVRAVTRLPGAPSFIAGLVNVRGTVLTVLDVGARLGGTGSVGPVLAVEVAGRRFGLRVDAVDGVRRVDATVLAVDEARSAAGAVAGQLPLADGTAALVLDVAALGRSALAEA